LKLPCEVPKYWSTERNFINNVKKFFFVEMENFVLTEQAIKHYSPKSHFLFVRTKAHFGVFLHATVL
jgi:hypothetical protein